MIEDNGACSTLSRAPRLIPRRQLLRLSVGSLGAASLAIALTTCSGSVGTSAQDSASAAAASRSGRSAAMTSAASAAAAPVGSSSDAASTSSAPVSVVGTGRRGQAGTLKVLFWQAVTTLNPHLSVGIKDGNASRLVLEPLFTAKTDGTILPVLAAEVPSLSNGGLSSDGTTVTIKLKPDVTWSDGEPFTADDAVFTWQYVTDKATAATSIGAFQPIETVAALDPQTVKVTYAAANPDWSAPFLGTNTVLPKHILQDYVGAKARQAPFNQKPIGTGPYKVDTFTPGDLVVYSINDKYRDPDKPAFARVQIKGGGDAASAARAVFETGEYHYASNLQVEWPVLRNIMQGGKGDLVASPGGGTETLWFNMSDPNKEVDGQKSHLGTPHTILSDPTVRQAISMAIDRDTIAKNLYGETGDATVDVLSTPTSMKAADVSIPFDIPKANQLLDQAGWKTGSDGIRAKDGLPIKLVFQTTINSLRQKEQAVIKAGCQQLGIDLTLKTVESGVFFGSDPGNPDTNAHFYADLEMFEITVPSPTPVTYMQSWASNDPSVDIPQKANSWSGNNYARWENADFNALYQQALTEVDTQKLNSLMKQMNDLVVKNCVTVGLIDRKRVDCKAKWLDGPDVGVFDADTWNIADWTKKGQ